MEAWYPFDLSNGALADNKSVRVRQNFENISQLHCQKTKYTKI
jgi:hypothetical protein